MEPYCDECKTEKAKHEIVTGYTGPFDLFPINKHFCTGCYAKYLANKSIDKVITTH